MPPWFGAVFDAASTLLDRASGRWQHRQRAKRRRRREQSRERRQKKRNPPVYGDESPPSVKYECRCGQGIIGDWGQPIDCYECGRNYDRESIAQLDILTVKCPWCRSFIPRDRCALSNALRRENESANCHQCHYKWKLDPW